jgi:hypothetical protein
MDKNQFHIHARQSSALTPYKIPTPGKQIRHKNLFKVKDQIINIKNTLILMLDRILTLNTLPGPRHT